MAEKILVTSALPYVNAVPHLGTLIGCVLSADVFARYCRLRGYETLFICGTDEHGTATETKALEEGLTPQQICDKYYKIHKDVYEWIGCSFDAFGRTSTDTHTEMVQSIFKKVLDNGYILKDALEQPWCPKCDKFLADRFVEGTCPHCGHDGARGDQCQSCDKLLNAVDLVNPKCKTCGTKAQIKKSNHLFLDLPKLGPQLEKWAEGAADSGFWTENAKTVTKAWFKEGLKQRCVSRDLKWGIPIPLEGYTEKVFYVWFDAPIGYISITKHAFPDQWEAWWKGEDVRLYQFMAKDNIPFHTLIFPATLMAADDGWNLLHHIDSTEYLNYEGGKFSKTDGTGVFGDDVMSTGIPPDVWRYYLLSSRPEAADTYFSWKEFQERNNNELLANLGNFVNRTLTFTHKYFDGKVPGASLTDADDKMISSVNEHVTACVELMEKVKEREALREVMNISRLGNQYFQENAPWQLVKDGQMERCGTVLNICCNLVRTLAVLAEPFLPNTSKDVFGQLGLDCSGCGIEYKMHLDLEPGHALGEAKVLFRKLEDKEIDDFRQKFGGKAKQEKKAAADVVAMEEFPADLRVAKIESVEDHPDAGKLYVMQIDIGTEKRQLVAGLKAYIPRENLLGKKIVVVCNLKPAKLRGVESNGMLLAADDGKKVVLLEAPDSDPGDEVVVEGVPNVKEFSQLSIDEFFKLHIEVDASNNVVVKNFKNKRLKAAVEYVVAPGIGEGAKVR
ncbi:methionine--tRNA ligase [Candidatus Woesearchaeota archaeon]|nr:methionine--tRNA ligase [Candidatus Woesearchaeota archaeon]